MYAAALAGEKIEIGRGRAEPGSASSIVIAYLVSDSFKALKSPVTRSMHRCTLERFAAKHGALPFKLLDKGGVERVLGKLVETPGARRNLKNVLRRMMRWAVEKKIITTDPTEGIKTPLPRTEGWHTMTDAERNQYRAYPSDWHEGASCIRAFLLHGTSLFRRLQAWPAALHRRPLNLVQQKTGETGPCSRVPEAPILESIAAANRETVGNVAPSPSF